MALHGEIIMEFCRLCQSRLGKTPLLCDEELINKILEVTKVKVNDELNSYLPMLLCLSCHDKVIEIYNFVQNVQNVDKNLRNAIKIKYFPASDKIHEESEQTYKDVIKCDKCPSTFSDKNLLNIHKKSHDDDQNIFKCSNCSKVYNRERSFNLHKKNNCIKLIEGAEGQKNRFQRKHKSKTKPKFKIKTELLKFPTSAQDGDTFQCNNCDKKFSDKNNLRHHLKIHKRFVCSEKSCLKKLPSAYALKIHQLDHQEKRPYLCVTCGKSFRTKSSLSCHEKIHSDIKGYKCDSCNIGFSVRSNLRAHEKKYHEGIRFYCSQCTKEFMSKCSLERHEKIHAGIKEFKCQHCSSAFYTNKELMKHQIYHQGLKQHKCEECFKTFFERHHLIIHLRSHSGERPYVCKVPGCGKAFAESQKLKRHHTAKHNSMS